jgi:predicted nuclease with RNAse H fold
MSAREATVAGIDVGGTKKGFHLVILRGREILQVACEQDAARLPALCIEFEAEVIGIDAPCKWGAEGSGRSAERALARERISCFSTPTEARANASTSGFYEWMFNGLRAYRAFAATHPVSATNAYRGERVCIETFPHAITCALLGRDTASAKLKRQQRKQMLDALGIDIARLKTIDALDAALCAFTAQLFVEGRTRAYGDAAGDYIHVPDIGHLALA